MNGTACRRAAALLACFWLTGAQAARAELSLPRRLDPVGSLLHPDVHPGAHLHAARGYIESRTVQHPQDFRRIRQYVRALRTMRPAERTPCPGQRNHPDDGAGFDGIEPAERAPEIVQEDPVHPLSRARRLEACALIEPTRLQPPRRCGMLVSRHSLLRRIGRRVQHFRSVLDLLLQARQLAFETGDLGAGLCRSFARPLAISLCRSGRVLRFR